MSSPLRLGDLQVAILRVLWDEGEATVARVTEALPGKRRAPTTIATMLTKMERKGLVDHRVDGRQFVYHARLSEQEVTRTMVADLTQRLFEGDVSALVSHLIRSEEIDRDELVRLRAMIVERERLEARSRTGAPAGNERDERAADGARAGSREAGGDDDDE